MFHVTRLKVEESKKKWKVECKSGKAVAVLLNSFCSCTAVMERDNTLPARWPSGLLWLRHPGLAQRWPPDPDPKTRCGSSCCQKCSPASSLEGKNQHTLPSETCWRRTMLRLKYEGKWNTIKKRRFVDQAKRQASRSVNVISAWATSGCSEVRCTTRCCFTPVWCFKTTWAQILRLVRNKTRVTWLQFWSVQTLLKI